MDGADRGPNLHLNGDIPVVVIQGEWNESTGRGLIDTVGRLIRAGHLEIILNVARMTDSTRLDCTWMDALATIAASVRAHFGRLDVVGTREQAERYIGGGSRTRLLWAASEEEAIGRIKGLPVYRSGPILSMRLVS